MLSSQAVYGKVRNLYNQANQGNIPITAAIRRIKVILGKSGNPKVKPYIDSWNSFVNIHPKSYYLRKMDKEYPTIQHDEAKFEHEHLGVPVKEACKNAKQAKQNMLRDFNDVYQMPCKLVQYNSQIGRFLPAMPSGLKTLLYDLNVDNEKDGNDK